MKHRRETLAWLLLGLSFGGMAVASARAGEPLTERDYDRHAHRVVARDAFPVLFDPPLTPAGRVRGRLQDRDLVIGVTRGNASHAYPVQVMGVHELVNDTLDGEPIAVSW